MSYTYLGIGVVIGFFIGIGAMLFYIRWKMSRQLGMMQDQMENMMDMSGDLDQSLEDLEPDVEKVDEEEKKD